MREWWNWNTRRTLNPVPIKGLRVRLPPLAPPNQKEIIMEDGIITFNSQIAQSLGFTRDKFSGDSYLWKIGNSIYISNIESKEKGKGYLRSLFESIEANNLAVKVPTPLRRMQEILQKNNFVPIVDDNMECEVWGRPLERK
jgi:hypothetical protein